MSALKSQQIQCDEVTKSYEILVEETKTQTESFRDQLSKRDVCISEIQKELDNVNSIIKNRGLCSIGLNCFTFADLLRTQSWITLLIN